MRAVPAWRDKLMELGLLALLVAVMYILQLGCPILRLTGVPCPGCGMTRACLAVLRGDFAQAFRLHAMVFALPLLLLLFLYDGKPFRAQWINVTLMVLVGAGFAANWVFHLI